MSAVPNTKRVTLDTDLPYSFSKDDKQVYNRVKDIKPAIIESAKMEMDTISKNGLTLYFRDEDKAFTDEHKQRFVEMFFTQYPKLIKQYNSASTKNVTFFIDTKYNGVAEAGGGRVRFNPIWFNKNLEDLDAITHELMHLVQEYGYSNCPGWVTEGIADYVRAVHGINNIKGGWKMPDVKPEHNFKNSYRITARFFIWITQHYSADFIIKLDDSIRQKKYTENTWKEMTGKTVEELWKEYTENSAITFTYQ